MALSKQEVRQIITAVRQMPVDTLPARVEDFISQTLGLNAVQRGVYFPSPDPAGLLEVAIAHLTKEREKILRDECIIPTFAVYQDVNGRHFVSGFNSYLASKNVDANLRGRLRQHSFVRMALRRMRNGHDLEAFAAAILDAKCDYGEATRGSGDQGIDAIGWKELVLIEPCFSEGDFVKNQVLPGEKVFLFASSKAFTDGKDAPPKQINPAHIRELVGGWIIQRSSAGKWQPVGIRMLSPVQMILVTTYRLSIDSKAECRSLGVQVWGIPELVYLCCAAAPANVFDAANNHAFSTTAFNTWWRAKNQSRLMTA
jgi:hypothetical protein